MSGREKSSRRIDAVWLKDATVDNKPVICLRETSVLVVKRSVSRLQVVEVETRRLVGRVLRLELQHGVVPGQRRVLQLKRNDWEREMEVRP